MLTGLSTLLVEQGPMAAFYTDFVLAFFVSLCDCGHLNWDAAGEKINFPLGNFI